MPANRHFAITRRAEMPGNDFFPRPVLMRNKTKVRRHFFVELAMKRCGEIGQGRARQSAGPIALVDPALNDHMRPRLKCRGTGRLLQFGTGQCALDIAGPGGVPFDQVRGVSVHDPHQIGRFASTFRMQPPANVARRPLDFDGKIGAVRRQAVLERAGFNAGGCPEQGLPIKIVDILLARQCVSR